MTLRIVFLGTPDFAAASLVALAEAGHEILAVYSQPPRKAGRGQKPRPSPVQALAEQHGWTVRTPTSLRGEEEIRAFRALEADVAVVAAYGLILPRGILEAPRFGCLNVHASLLPRWRGAAPIQRAILAGDRETGVCIMQMDEGLDTGPVLLREAVPIGPETTGGELHDTLAALGARLLVEALEGLEAGGLSPEPQPAEGTYAAKLDKRETRLDWRLPAAELERVVRAFNPWPGATLALPEGEGALKVLRARVEAGEGVPGTVLDERLLIACGRSALRLLEVQRPGRAPLPAEAFLRGFRLPAGLELPLSDPLGAAA